MCEIEEGEAFGEAGEEQKQAEEGEEGQRPKAVKVAVQPSAKEVQEHMLTHVPFRNWCTHCVAGKAKNNPH